MERREFLKRTATGLGAAALASAEAEGSPVESNPPSEEAPHPNILFIMTDQQRFDSVGANGNPLVRTPNLDRLASESANFSHCYVQSPVCVPSRACFFTGRYAHSHRNRVNYTQLPADEVLMQTRLQQAGYQTCLVGKTHLYYCYPPTREQAMRTGFDVVELHDGAESVDAWSDYAKWRNERDSNREFHYRALARTGSEAAAMGVNPFLSVIEDEFTDTTWTGLKTREHLKRLANEGKPFFLFSSFWKPHSPYEVPKPFDSLFDDVEFQLPKAESLAEIQRLPLPLQKLILRGDKPPYDMDRERLQWIYRSYHASITHIDREVGLILNSLTDLAIENDTIVVFCSDHGDQLLEHGLLGKNVFFEGSVRVPFMIRIPGKSRAGQYEDFIESIDVLPTLFEAVGLEEPYDCQGRSFLPLIEGRREDYAERDAVFSENIIPEVFSKSFIFEKGRGVGGIRHPDAKMVRTRDWKLNYYPEGELELYDLRNDPNETHNLVGDSPRRGIESELKDRILHWLCTSAEADQIAPRWLV